MTGTQAVAQEGHTHVPKPRGDHAITVHLCHDCDCWYADDGSTLYNDGQKREWEAALKQAQERIEELEVKGAEDWLRANAAEAEVARLRAGLEQAKRRFVEIQQTDEITGRERLRDIASWGMSEVIDALTATVRGGVMATEWTPEKIDTLPDRLRAAELWLENAEGRPIHNWVLPHTSRQKALRAILEYLRQQEAHDDTP